MSVDVRQPTRVPITLVRVSVISLYFFVNCYFFHCPQNAHREHYRSDLHRYNLKLKMKGVPPVSEDEFRLVDAEDFFHRDF